MEREIQATRIELVKGDITDQHVDAIVNAANSRLAGGGGVDGAIHRRGGPEIMAQTDKLYPQGCPTGSAVITAAGNLPAKFVVHAVGPIWRGGESGEHKQLAAAYQKSLELAEEQNCKSIAFPSLSTGAYGFPLSEAAGVALSTTARFLGEHPSHSLQLVRFVLWGDDAYDAFSKALESVKPSC